MRSIMRRARAVWASAHADLELRAGRYREAERLARRALRLTRGTKADALHLHLWNTVGMACKYARRFSAAARAYARAMQLLSARAKPDAHALAALLHNRGGLEHARSHHRRGEVFARRGIAVRTAAFGAGHEDVARDLAALGALLDGQGRHRDAEECHRRALEIFRRSALPPRRDVAAALGNLAACLHEQGRAREAVSIGERGLAMSVRTLGRHHPEAELAAANLALMRRAAGPASGLS